jgi:ATP-dependent RNA helicase DDX54/DBP10
MLVFDEADRLFELGFAEQLHKVLEGCPASRQVMLFSATLPAQLVAFTRAGIKNPAMVRLDVETTLSDNLELQFLYTRKDEKLAATITLLRRLHQSGKQTVMFVATKHHVEFFGELLKELGLTVAVVYGAMEQELREHNVHRFRKRKAGILVTTDVAARGIDIPLLDHVVNFDFPPSSKLFVHRCGRTARAGRSGLAISMLTLEDLPYTVELMLFLGIKLTVATGRPALAPFKPGDCPVIGAIPSVQLEVETLLRLLPTTKHEVGAGSQLVSLFKSMNASYHLYNRTRPGASKSSLARAKELLEECGGAARLQGLMHPEWCDADGQNTDLAVEKAVKEQELIKELRGFRPRVEKKGNVISTASMKTMTLSKRDSEITAEVRKSAGAHADKKIEDILNLETSQSNDRKRSREEMEKRAAEEALIVDKPRQSKRGRKKNPQGGGKNDTFEGFDVQVDGVDVSDEPTKKGKPATDQFYLSTERNLDEEAKERGLDMDSYQLDLCPDEGGQMQVAKSVIKWDAKKKKYLPVMVAADGRVVKQRPGQRKDESGQNIKDDGGKSGSYSKWAKQTKKRIQKVGELENENQGVPLGQKAQQRLAQQAKAKTVDFGGDDEGGGGGGGGDENTAGTSNRKPIVPFTGDVDAKYLTHKQKRMMHKRDQNDRVIQGSAASELKSAVEIVTDKNKRNQNKVKQNPHMRKALASAAKDKRRAMHEDRQMKYGAKTKSRMMIFDGPKKGFIKGKSCKTNGKGAKRRVGLQQFGTI